MMEKKQKVILITGASSGIGYDAAKELAEQGHKVYAAARRVANMEPLKAFGIVPVCLDVTQEDSCEKVVQSIVREEGRIDVLVNNAGYGLYGSVEDTPMSKARNVFDVNVFGLAMMAKLVIPYMRAQHSGTIINMSSMGGKAPTYFGAWYHATKFAVEGFSDCLRMELSGFNINVVIIEPGGIKTPFGDIAADNLEASSKGGAYEKEAAITASGMRKQYNGNMLSKPKVVTRAIVKAVNARHPKTRYMVGFGAKPVVWMRALLPDRWYDKLMHRANSL